MKTTFITTKDNSFREFFSDQLEKSKYFNWAVAYGTHSAYKSFESSFGKFFRGGGISRAVFDITDGVTEPDLLEELITLPGGSSCRVYIGNRKKMGILHSKLYIFYGEKKSSIYSGSANFTIPALNTNLECGINLTCNLDAPFFQKMNDFFFQEIWGSDNVYPLEENPNLLEEYTRLYNKKSRKSAEFNSKLIAQLINFVEVSQKEDFTLKSTKMAYLLGLVCASAYNLKSHDINNRIINLKYRSNVRGSGRDRGFISARIDGILLGEIQLPQYQTQYEALKKIYDDISKFIKTDSRSNNIEMNDMSSEQTNIEIRINFAENSKILPKLVSCIKQFESVRGELVPIVPKEIHDSKDINIKLSFLRSYFDFRSRISQADRYPYGKLRIALQISKYAYKFADQLKEILENDFGVYATLESGASRGKDNILRFIPDENCIKFFSTGWARIMASEFIKFNKLHHI